MRGVILAGGLGTRLHPATKVTNKHLLPVYDKPMIHYPLQTLLGAGINTIHIITGPEYAGHFMKLLGSGRSFGAKFSYDVQEEPLGIAHALGMAEDFAAREKIAVILGDNLIEDDLRPDVKRFLESGLGSMVFLKEVEDPERFGVAEIKEDKIVSIEEKPKIPKSKLAVTGVYMYDNKVFDIIRTLKPSNRGQYEITDVNGVYASAGRLGYRILKGFWSDMGTHESLFKASQYAREKLLKKPTEQK